MSRGISPNSTSFEVVSCCSPCKHTCLEQDVISNLKVQVFTKDQNKKNLKNLLSMYHNLEDEILKISEQKKVHEIALNKFESDERNNAIIELKNKNENLFNELNEKIALNKKLYNENNKLFQELEARTTQSDNLQEQIRKQEILIRQITCDNEEIKKKIVCLSQVKGRQENDIHELNIQINQLNLQSNDQVNILKNKNGQNCQIINIINEEKNINKSLQIELKSKESNLISNQQQLNKNNDNIHLIKSDINNVENIIKKENEDISIINTNLLKETSINKQLNIDNLQLNNLVKDRDENIKKINSDNNIIKQGNTELNCQNDKLNKLIQAYKKHLCLLVSQNKKLANEIQFLITRDGELKTILERDNHLKEIQYENEQFIKNSIDKIKLGAPNVVSQNLERKSTTIKRTYSIDGNNGIKAFDSPSRAKNVNHMETINQIEDREINPNISGILTQENKLSLSQNYFHNNENEMEEFA